MYNCSGILLTQVWWLVKIVADEKKTNLRSQRKRKKRGKKVQKNERASIHIRMLWTYGQVSLIMNTTWFWCNTIVYAVVNSAICFLIEKLKRLLHCRQCPLLGSDALHKSQVIRFGLTSSSWKFFWHAQPSYSSKKKPMKTSIIHLASGLLLRQWYNISYSEKKPAEYHPPFSLTHFSSDAATLTVQCIITYCRPIEQSNFFGTKSTLKGFSLNSKAASGHFGQLVWYWIKGNVPRCAKIHPDTQNKTFT